MELTPHPILLSLSNRLLQVTAAISLPAAKGASKGRFSVYIRSEGPHSQMQDFERRVRRELQRRNGAFSLPGDLADPPQIQIFLSHNHHFKWWFGLALIRADYMRAQKGGYRKRCHWSAYKAVLLESSFLDSSACSLIYFFIASSVILPIVET